MNQPMVNMPIFIALCISCLSVLFWANNSQAALNQESVLSIEASKAAVAGDYRQAIAIYSRLIALDPKDANHYIQRGLMYRQIKQKVKSMADGAMALEVAKYNLQNKSTGSKGAKHFWQRSMAYRLLEKYDLALNDIQNALNLKRDLRWMNDQKAIVLEQKIHSAQ